MLGIQLELDVAAQSHARHVHAPTVDPADDSAGGRRALATGSCANNCAPSDVLYLAEGYARQDIRRRLDADDPPPASHAAAVAGAKVGGKAPAGVPFVSDSHAIIGCAFSLGLSRPGCSCGVL